MGFELHAVIAACAGPDDAGALIAAARDEIPYVTARYFDDPFEGVMAWLEPDDVWEAWERDPSAFPYRNAEDAYEDIHGGVHARVPALSRRFPGRAFVLVELDCFGGMCLYRGHIVRDGDRGPPVATSQRGHLALFAQAGLPHREWYFAPFTRAFLVRSS